MDELKIIVGLGNPGDRYAKTRHNLGEIIVSSFAAKHGLTFKKETKFQSLVAQGHVACKQGEGIEKSCKVLLVLPQTYMNLSGIAVRKIVDFFKILPSKGTSSAEATSTDFQQLLVVVDDVYLRFGSMRWRPYGSSGGHNGLKNIEAQLGTGRFPRLRLGVGPQTIENGKLLLSEPLEEYVLKQFSSEEQTQLQLFVNKSIEAIENWLFDRSLA